MTSNTPQKSDTVTMHWRGLRIVSSYIPRFFTSIVLYCIVTAAMPYVSLWLLARLIDCLVRQDANGAWMWTGVTLAVQTVMILLAGVIKRWKEAKWERLYRVADRIIADKLLSLDHADLDDHDTRRLLGRVREHMSELDGGLVQIPQIVQHILLGVFGILGAVLLSWRLLVAVDSPLVSAAALTVMVMAAALALRLKTASRRKKDTKNDEVVSLDRLYYTLYGTMFDATKAADVRLYRQDRAIEQYLTQADRSFFSKKGLKHIGFGRDSVSEALSAVWLGAACMLVVVNTAVGIGGIVQTVGALAWMWTAVDNIGEGVYRLRKNTAYLQTVLTFLDVPHRLYQGSLTTEKRADRDYELEFRHVSFRYPSQTAYALKDVSVVFRAGSRVAVVGENGSGKSTFVKLICRLYDPDEGDILLNGIDIRKYRYAEYMAIIAVVMQDFQLLAQPLGNTVASASVYDGERVWQCLEDASFDRTDPLWERGLETPLYRDCFASGVSVPLGEAQKIAIARALYKNAPFMILDEPTAALDPVTEAEIYENFDRIAEDRTVLYVSHRLSGCRFCDEILVFDRGKIVQRGTHEELLCEKDGQYRKLWYAQAQYYMT